MAEYIEREAVLKLFDKVGCYLNPKCLERQQEQIKQLPTADVVPVEWISVKDRLPETDGKYLCAEYSKTFKKHYLNVSRFATDLYKVDKHDFCDEKGKSGFYGYSSGWGYFKEGDVTHWMPLPEPPKKEAVQNEQ